MINYESSYYIFSMNSLQSFSVSKMLPFTIAGDISLILIFIAVSLAFGLYLGRSQLVSIVMFTYIDAALLSVFPADMFAFSIYGKVGVFLGLLLFLYFTGDYLLDIHISGSSSDFFWRIVLMSFLAVGMITSILLSMLPKVDVLKYLSVTSSGYFISQNARIAWMVLPILFLLFINKRLR